jgi:hypothetical protein
VRHSYPEQLLLALEDIEQAIAAEKGRRGQKGRGGTAKRAAPIAARFLPTCRAWM